MDDALMDFDISCEEHLNFEQLIHNQIDKKTNNYFLYLDFGVCIFLRFGVF